MANLKPDGGPAFPKPFSTDEHKDQCNVGYEEQGMSLRDYFAGQAMAGLLAEHAGAKSERIAGYSYELADEMIEARDA